MRGIGRAGSGWVLVLALLGVALVAAGCSSGGANDAGGGEAAVADRGTLESTVASDLDEAAEPPAPGRADQAGAANRPTVRTRAVIRKGQVSLVTPQMNAAREQVDRLLERNGGYLASEDTHNDRAGRPERSVLVLRVPEPAFDTVMSDLVEIGRPERADRSAEDVTTEVIDVDSRVATAEASLARLQRFLRQARDVDDMIRLESEIATRQAELESLKAQQAYLADATAMASVEVRLRTPAAPPAPEPEDEQGFLAGLGSGWAALRVVLTTSATVLGALVPFATAALLLGAPVWLVARRVRRRRPAPQDPATAADAG